MKCIYGVSVMLRALASRSVVESVEGPLQMKGSSLIKPRTLCTFGIPITGLPNYLMHVCHNLQLWRTERTIPKSTIIYFIERSDYVAL